MLVELQAAGHTTFARYSTCARDIVRNYLLNSEVGIFFVVHSKPVLTERGGDARAVAARVYKVRGGF